MDEIVARAMLKWPEVPAVFGWLRLDRRGSFLVKTAAGRFERIANPAVVGFIGRNYGADAGGRWYFQNGPQRVYVALDYTPWVYRLDDSGREFVAHTGAAPRELRAAFLDDAGSLLVETELGVGVILDRDLPAVLERIDAADAVLESVRRGARTEARLQGRSVPVAGIRAADVEARFGFVARPAPPSGEPDCR